MFYDNHIGVIFKFISTWLSIVLLVFALENFAYSQPLNNDCANAVDISDQSWYPGTSVGATINCTNDLRTGNCGAAQQGVDMCCGIMGIESSIWYSFIVSATQVVYIDFRNISCTNASSLQGFSFSTGNCVTPELDVIKACFKTASTADINGQMTFTAVGGQLYYLEIDTEKNTLTSCGTCTTPSSTCHANCNWEIRLRTNTPTLLKDFNLSINNSSVVSSWYYDYKENYSHFKIIRKKLTDNSMEVVSEEPVNKYHLSGYNFQFDDYTVKENGLYNYYLYGSYEGSYYEPIVNKTIFVGYVNEIDFFLIPNPAKDDLTISISNLKDGKAAYEIYSLLGIKIISGIIDSPAQYSQINTCLFPKGIYFVKVVIGNDVHSKKLLLN
jgi:hypothetical protein